MEMKYPSHWPPARQTTCAYEKPAIYQKEKTMFTKKFVVVLIIVTALLSACAPQVAPPTAVPTSASWSLVVVGDSIPYNSPEDCPGCKSFADRYAEAVTAATGHPVEVRNLSLHNGLQIDGLLEILKTDSLRRDALANADIIIVGIAHNDAAMNSNDDVCDGPNGDNPDWSKYSAECAIASAELFRPKFESVYSQIVELRAGKPTVFLTINRYNDWNGWPGHELSPEGIQATKEVIDAWNEMICKAAQQNDFLCADIYPAFNGPDGLKPSGDLVAVDYTHPSDRGNEVIASILVDLGFAPLVP